MFKRVVFCFIFCLLFFGVSFVNPVEADAWWNNSWTYRKQIWFDNRASDTLTDFPVMVKLTAGNFDFEKTLSGGADIRFTDSNDSSSLSYEIEKWDSTAKEAIIWVSVPTIDAYTSGDYIYMYYGNSAASDSQSATSVWNSSFNGVWHLGGNPTTSVSDSTTTGTTLSNAGSLTSANQVSGLMGGSINFTNNCTSSGCFATNTYLKASAGGSDNYEFGASQDFSVSTWVNTTEAQTPYYAAIVGNASDGSNIRQFRLLIDPIDQNGKIWFQVLADGSSGGASKSVHSTTKVTDGNWHFITGTRSGTTLKIYVDGVLEATDTVSSNPTLSGAGLFQIGADQNQYFHSAGKLDEVRVSTTARSSSWITADYKSNANTYLSFSCELTRTDMDCENLNQNSSISIPTGFQETVMAGPSAAPVSVVSGGGEAAKAVTIISSTAHHFDVHIDINKISPESLNVTQTNSTLPKNPKSQMLKQAGDIFEFNAVSSFNGYKAGAFDKPVTVQIPYNPELLKNSSTKRLKLAWFDTVAKKWRVLRQNNVVNEATHTVANTTKNLSFFTIIIE